MESITTVTEPADDFALITVDEFKADQNIESNDDDDWFEEKIRRISSKLSSECDRIFVEQAYSQVFRWGCEELTSCLVLSQYPVSNVVVTEGGTQLQDSDFEVDSDAGLVFRLCGSQRVPFGRGTAVVTFQGGFDEIPDDLKDAAIAEMKAANFTRTRDSTLRAQSQPGLGEQQYWVGTIPGQNGAWSPDAMVAIEKYRRVSVG